MKLQRLDLIAFGHFTNVSLDLSAGNHGLHVIYGPNEAGKSTTLRALRQFLYGFEHIASDTFLHDKGDLRVGALLESSSGESFYGIRRRGNKNTLRSEDDKTIIEPEKLHRLLGGLEEKAFRDRFGIDHDQLVRGGQEIVQGGGDIGEILFAAGSGIANLGAIERDLQREAEEFYKSGRATVPAINRALVELKKTREQIRALSLVDSDWVRHDQALKSAQQRKAELENRRLALAKEKQRLERFQNALADIVRRTQLQRELTQLGDTPRLPEDFAEMRRQALAGLDVARQAEAEACAQLESLDQELAHLNVPETLLNRAHDITHTVTDLGSYLKGQRDLPTLAAQRERLQKEIAATLERESASLLVGKESLRRLQSKVDRIRIQNLGNQYQDLVSKQQAARQRAGQLTQIREQLAHKMSQDAPRDPAELRRTIRRVQQQGALEEQLAAARHELGLLEKQAAIDLQKLPLWSGTLAELEALSLPTSESIQLLDQELASTAAELKSSQSRRDDVREQLQEITTKLEQLHLEQDVPTESELAKARQRRERGWHLVRQALLLGAEDKRAEQEFISSVPGSTTLAEAYEQSVREADELVDRLRREAEKVSRKASLLADQQARRQRLSEAEAACEAIQKAQEAVMERWHALWQPLGIEPLSPREMRSWLDSQLRLTSAAAAIRRQQTEVARLEERIAECRSALSEALAAISAPGAGDQESLAVLVERCEELIEQLESARAARQQLEHDWQRLQQELPAAEHAAQQADEALDAWRAQWAEAMQRAGLTSDATPDAANELLSIYADLQTCEKEVETLTGRMEGIDREAAEFRGRVRVLVEQLGLPWPEELPVEQIVQRLREQLAEAQTAQTRRQDLVQQRAREAEKQKRASEEVVKHQARIGVLCSEAGCEHVDELPEVEQRSRRRESLERELQQLEERLAKLTGTVPLDEFVTQAASVDPDQLGPEIDQLGEQLAELDREKSQLDQTIGSEQQALSAMDGSARAAEAKEEEQALLAQLAIDAEQYVRLRLAALALHDAIERYREKNQGPVLMRASQLFAELTLGRYERLEVDYNEAGQAILRGVRSTGKKVGVDGMSDGTADQLYLALRLASLEHYLDQHEPIPFIVDDILNRFDDRRALAALQILAELSHKTQVIFFTHHAHLAELAQEHLSSDVLFVHQLEAITAQAERTLAKSAS